MKKIVHLNGFKPSNCRALIRFKFLRKIKILPNLKVFTNLTNAFSLVEMLMALLVASLLLAALAPVMTRRMADHELKVISEASNYDKDLVVSVFTKDTDFNIPSDANQVRVTLMGGGGKGGDALYGNKEFTTSQSFTVPDGVTKLRVFMIGAGGGGASGGMGNGTAYGSIPAIGSTAHTITTAGTYIFPNVATVPDTHTAPALHYYCEKYGTTGKWIVKSDGTTQLAPGVKFPRIDSTATVNLTKFTACGAGGGGGYIGSGGGSGGYIADKTLSTSTTASNITLKIGAGGGGGTGYSSYGTGGSGGGTGGAFSGGNGSGNNGSGGNGGDGTIGGGGGGGGTAILSGSTVVAEIGGGGGGGACKYGVGSASIATPSIYGGGYGGGGGGYGSGGGGGDSALVFIKTVGCGLHYGTAGNSNGTRGYMYHLVSGIQTTAYIARQGGNGYGGGGGGGGSAYNDDTYGNANCTTNRSGTAASGTGGGGGGGRQGQYQAWSCGGAGGGGAGGKGGVGAGQNGTGGVGGAISTIFGANNCNGGNASTAAKPGAMKVTYTVNSVVDGLQCRYYAPSNGGGGGGAGQVWIGEINVTPNQVINLKIGQGGAVQNIGAENGNDGEGTSITVGSNTYSVSGGRGGKYESDSTYIVNTGGLGGGIKTNNFSSSAVYKDWLKLNEKVTGGLKGGTNGGQGYLETSAQNGAGGIGGSVLKMDGTVIAGGAGGADASEGVSVSAENYGAGGGGGAGGADGNFGNGGKGANGYVYIEWGGSNASGGTMGEFVQKTVTNLDPDPTKRTMKIRIGKGGGITGTSTEEDPDLFDSSTIGLNGGGGETSISIISGNKTVIHKARGGVKGNDGNSESGSHGEDKQYPDNYSDLYKEYVTGNMNIITGQAGSNDYGGMGGYLSCILKSKDEEGNKICNASVKSNDGNNVTLGPVRPGCGGTSIVSPLYEAICNAKSTTASADGGDGILGAGGGGGAVLNNTQGKGGNGGNGFVILEYKSTTLD